MTAYLGWMSKLTNRIQPVCLDSFRKYGHMIILANQSRLETIWFKIDSMTLSYKYAKWVPLSKGTRYAKWVTNMQN